MRHNNQVKITENTLPNGYKDVGLNSIDIEHKTDSLNDSLTKQLFTENLHEWNIVCLQYINKRFGKKFKFIYSQKIPYYIFLVSTKLY